MKINRKTSLYVAKFNKAAKRYINKCALCGVEGYAKQIEEEDFIKAGQFNTSIRHDLQASYQKLVLSNNGLCPQCASAISVSNDATCKGV